MPIFKRLIGNIVNAASLLPVGTKLAKQLDLLKLPVLRRSFEQGDVEVKVVGSNIYLLINGKELFVFGQIGFTGTTGTIVYNYDKGAFSNIGKVVLSTLVQLWSGLLVDNVYKGLTPSNKSLVIEHSFSSFVANYKSNQGAFLLADNSSLFLYTENQFSNVFNMSLASAQVMPSLAFKTQPYAFIPLFGTGALLWNLDNGISAIGVSETSFSKKEIKWIPVIHTIFPGEAFGLSFFPGTYYGTKGSPEYYRDGASEADPMKILDVELKCWLDTKKTFAAYDWTNYGWCEHVSGYHLDYDGEVYREANDLFFYFAQNIVEETPGNQTYIRTTYGISQVWMGSDFSGYFGKINKKFSIKSCLINDPMIYMWSFYIPLQESSAVGILIFNKDEKTCEVYKYSGALQPVYSTAHYHSHSVSVDGLVLAVFEQNPEIPENENIHKVVVFSFGGTGKDDEYSPAPVLISENTLPLDMAVGCVFPSAKESDAEIVDVGEAPTVSVEFGNAYSDALGGLFFTIQEPRAINITKLILYENKARFISYVDECMESRIIIESLDSANSEHFVGSYSDALGGGKVRGSFVLTKEKVLFDGEGTPKIIIEYSPTFGITRDSLDGIIYGGILGEFIPGDCIAETEDGRFIIDPECYDNCEDVIRVTASSSCGQSALLEIDNPIPPLTISGPMQMTVGSVYTVSGGRGEKFLDGPGLTKTSDSTWEVTTLACGPVTLAASDSCGNTETMLVRGGNGKWIVTLYVYQRYVGSGSAMPEACRESGSWFEGGVYCYYTSPTTYVKVTTKTAVNQSCSGTAYGPAGLSAATTFNNGPGCPTGQTRYWTETSYGRWAPHPPGFNSCYVEMADCTDAPDLPKYARPVSYYLYEWVCC